MSLISKKLDEMGIVLPSANPPAANYLPFKRVNNSLYISGQTCRIDGRMTHTGILGKGLSVKIGQIAARNCGLNILSQLYAACDGNLDLVASCTKLTVFVQCSNDFSLQAQVANGVSDLMVEVFGDKGKHIRAAVGVNALPSHSSVEVDAIFELYPEEVI